MKNRRFSQLFCLFLLCSVCIITQTGCGKKDQPISKDDYLLDTSCTISIYGMKVDGKVLGASELDEDKVLETIDNTYAECRRLESILSKTIESSDVARINASGGAEVEVSPEAAEVLSLGLKYSELSDGAFDITIGPISDLWDFHSEKPKLPDEGALAESLTHVGYEGVSLDWDGANTDRGLVRLADGAARLDLGGIAKGYIGDRAADYLAEAGVTSAIVNLGGNVIAIGGKPGEDGFTIGVEKPFSDRNELIGNVIAKDQTVVTSGIYERQFEVDGKTYHHVLSTSTGYPVETDLDSVTIVASKGHSVDADALSTICLILGSTEAKKLINSLDGYEAFFCLSDGTFDKTPGMDFNED